MADILDAAQKTTDPAPVTTPAPAEPPPTHSPFELHPPGAAPAHDSADTWLADAPTPHTPPVPPTLGAPKTEEKPVAFAPLPGPPQINDSLVVPAADDATPVMAPLEEPVDAAKPAESPKPKPTEIKSVEPAKTVEPVKPAEPPKTPVESIKPKNMKEPVAADKTPDKAPPGDKPKGKFSAGPIIAIVLFLLVTLPLGVFYFAQQQPESTDIRSRAADDGVTYDSQPQEIKDLFKNTYGDEAAGRAQWEKERNIYNNASDDQKKKMDKYYQSTINADGSINYSNLTNNNDYVNYMRETGAYTHPGSSQVERPSGTGTDVAAGPVTWVEVPNDQCPLSTAEGHKGESFGRCYKGSNGAIIHVNDNPSQEHPLDVKCDPVTYTCSIPEGTIYTVVHYTCPDGATPCNQNPVTGLSATLDSSACGGSEQIDIRLANGSQVGFISRTGGACAPAVPAAAGGVYQPEKKTNNKGPQCTKLKIYTAGTENPAKGKPTALTAAKLKELKAGSSIVFAVPAATGEDAARFRVNGGGWTQTSTKNRQKEFISSAFTLPSDTINFTIEAEVHIKKTNVWR